MKIKVLLIFLAFVPAVAYAKPTYLTCTFTVDGKPDVIKITADPDAGTVTTLIAFSGVVRKLPASFGPNEVTFGNADVSYKLSRVTLRLAKTINFINSTTYAQCRKLAVGKTAF